MSRILELTLPVLCLFVLAPGARADVLVVDAANGPGTHFTSLQPAVNAAQQDDTILIRSGHYAAPTPIGKPLAITADAGADVVLLGRVTVTGIAANRILSLRGLQFDSAGDTEAALFTGNAGLVMAESCSFVVTNPGAPSPAALTIFATNHAVLTDCEIVGADVDSFGPFDGAGLNLSSAGGRVFAFNTHIRGGNSPNLHLAVPFSTGSGRPAVVVESGLLALTGGSVSGGNGGSGISPTGGACLDGGKGGQGAYLTGASVRLDIRGGATVSGGPGGVTLAGCSDGADGADIDGGLQGFDDEVYFWPTAPRTWDCDNPSREGQSVTFTANGPANEPTFLALSLGGQTFWPNISPKGTLVVQAPLVLLYLGSLDPNGELSLNLSYPDIGAGVESVRLMGQAISLSGAGGMRFGDARALVFLDSGL